MDAWFTLGDSFRLLRDLPGEIRQLLRSLRSGEMNIRFEHRGLEPALHKADLWVNRLSFSLVLSALIIGSSVVIHSGIPPVVFGYPLIGLAGFAVAAVIGFALLFSIIRSRRW
jgi:ubiquinone biosynthesis protein